MEDESWRDRLDGQVPADLNDEIDGFATDLALMRAGRIEERLFTETRLRRGVYGQRYDNGKRHDGEKTQTIAFPSDAVKGPGTAWDAPGMMRIKTPMGRMSADQLEVLAEVAEEYSIGILHVTTRQDIQLHHVHIEDTPDLMRRLGAVGITTREACGNVVRNVTACATAGVCGGEVFDITPYADALSRFLLGHDDTQDFGRKMKIAFSGCRTEACGLVKVHDIGVLATARMVDGEVQRGFEVYVGGGLGAVPRQAERIGDFIEPDELLPLAQAICKVFTRLGERKNRTKARLKFLVAKLGMEAFTAEVMAERERLTPDERWKLDEAALGAVDAPSFPGEPATAALSGEVARWASTNVRPQRQAGYVTATVRLHLGDFTSDQARALAAICRTFTGDTLRSTIEQNLLLRWVPEARIPALFDALRAHGLHAAGAGTIADITSCPGTDTCKLGISSSRGLSAELQDRLDERLATLHPDARGLRIKISGCFNSCGQHHVADVGFLGVARNEGGRRVPCFQLVVGGQWLHNGGSYGMRVAAFPAKRVPDLVEKLVTIWLDEREPEEAFADFVQRAGRARLRTELDPFSQIPSYDDDPSFYTDWGDAREYTIGDKGVGECAGELVPATAFGLQAAERRLFDGQLALDRGAVDDPIDAAIDAMRIAARTLVKIRDPEVPRDLDSVVAGFRTHLHETKVFHDPYAGGKFALYLLNAHRSRPASQPAEARRAIEEATLFLEAAQACFLRLQENPKENA